MPFDAFEPTLERIEFDSACCELLEVFDEIDFIQGRLEILRNSMLSRGHDTPLNIVQDLSDVFDMVEDSLDVVHDAQAIAYEIFGEELDEVGEWVPQFEASA